MPPITKRPIINPGARITLPSLDDLHKRSIARVQRVVSLVVLFRAFCGFRELLKIEADFQPGDNPRWVAQDRPTPTATAIGKAANLTLRSFLAYNIRVRGGWSHLYLSRTSGVNRCLGVNQPGFFWSSSGAPFGAINIQS